ncbi:MAG: LysM peptidoglycan-binding domain-containing protein [Clostridia bacterium]
METQNIGQGAGRICPRGASRYTWQFGDTLDGLALANGVTQQAIRLVNEGLDFNQIQAGDTVCVPPRQLTCVSGSLYTVRRGDTFTSIAERYGISTLELSERNPYVDQYNLAVGQTLCVPRQNRPVPPPVGPGTPVPPIAPPPPITPPSPPGPVGPGTPVPPIAPPPPITPPSPPGPPPRPPRPPRPPQPPIPPQPPRPPQPIPPQPIPRCPNGYREGYVQPGQIFSDILRRYNVSYQAFELANPRLNMARLIPGQRFCAPPAQARRLCENGGRSYVIERGYDLASTARLLGVTTGELLYLNATLAPGDFIPGRVICRP